MENTEKINDKLKSVRKAIKNAYDPMEKIKLRKQEKLLINLRDKAWTYNPIRYNTKDTLSTFLDTMTFEKFNRIMNQK